MDVHANTPTGAQMGTAAPIKFGTLHMFVAQRIGCNKLAYGVLASACGTQISLIHVTRFRGLVQFVHGLRIKFGAGY